MINVSNEFKELMNKRTDFKEYAEVTLGSGTSLTFDESDFTLSGNNHFFDGAGANSIPLGEAICRNMQIELMNDDGSLNEHDFLGAKIRLYLKFQLSSSIEKIEIGDYTVISPATYGTTVIITAVDDMYKADKPFSTSLTFPQSAGALLRDIGSAISIPVASSTFLNSDLVVETCPSSNYTFRQVIGFIAMVACGNARISRSGNLEILTYSFDYTKEHHILKDFSLSTKFETDDISITGIRTKRTVETSDGYTEEEEIQIGEDGYLLSIENPLIAGKEEEILNSIGNILIDHPFRKFEGDYIGYPIAEFMDLAEVEDMNGVLHKTFITDITFTFASFTTLKNSADSGIINNSQYSNEYTKVIIDTEKLVDQEKTDRELAIERLNELLKNSSGMFSTEVKQEDGSTIFYLHDKPTLEESKNVIKVTAEAIGFSLDGGKTYNYGVTIDGEMIMRIIQTEGLNADWIKTGAFIIRDDSGNIIFSADIDTKKVIISGDSVTIGGKPIKDAISEDVDTKVDEAINNANLSPTVNVVLSNEVQLITTDYLGNYQTFPETKTTVTVYSGQLDVSHLCEYLVTNLSGTEGEWNNDTRTYTATGLTKDNGGADIQVTYIPYGEEPITITKRFTISKAKAGQQGQPGLQGDDGTDGISVADVWTYWTLSENGETLEDDIISWDLNKPTTIPSGMYLWRYDSYHFSNGDVKNTSPYVVTGEKGDVGAPGSTSYFHIKYSSVANPTSSDQMTETPSTYIGTYVDFSQTDSTDPSKYTWSRFEGLQGKDGEDGIPGKNGENGLTQYLHIKYSNDGGQTLTSNNGETPGDYIGQYVDFTQEDSTDPRKYTWSKSKGDPGETGASGRVYILEPSTSTIRKGADNAFSPTSVTFKSYYRDGTSATRAAYSGRFKIEETTNGSTWTTKYTSSTNENTKSYTPSSATVKSIRCTLYASGGTTTQLDIQTVVILTDVDNIDVVAEINASNGIVTLKGNRVIIDSNYFKVTAEGKITSTGGTIGGFTISDSSLSVHTTKQETNGVTTTLYPVERKTILADESIEMYYHHPKASISSKFDRPWTSLKGRTSEVTYNMLQTLEGYSVTYKEGTDYISSFELAEGGFIFDETTKTYDEEGSVVNGNMVFSYNDGILTLENKTDTTKKIRISAFGLLNTLPTQAIRPKKTGTYGCGLSDYRWSTVYSEDINATGVIKFSGITSSTSVNRTLYVGATAGQLYYRATTSSRTIKHDIVPLCGNLDARKLYDVEVVQFKYNKGVIPECDQRYMTDMPGFIIEDLNEIYPIAVDKETEDVKDWGWNASYLIPPMLKLMQEQNKRINILEQEVLG